MLKTLQQLLRLQVIFPYIPKRIQIWKKKKQIMKRVF